MWTEPRFRRATGLRIALFSTSLAIGCSSGARPGGGTHTESGGSGAPARPGSGGSPAGTGGATTGGTGGLSTGAAGAAGVGAGGSGGRSGSGGDASSSGGSSASGGRAEGGGGAGGTGGGGGGQAGLAGAGWNSAFPTFTRHTIATFSSGYSACLADIDHDGLLDVVALSSGSAGLVWFKNPAWTKYTITTKATRLIHMAPHDVDGDGDLDLAVISDFDMNDTMAGGTISWAEAPADPTATQDWALHAIGAIPTSHRVRWADIDGDGKKELLALPIFGVGSTAPAHAGAVQLTAFTIPAEPKAGKWTSKVLDKTRLEVAHALTIVDWDGDEAEDILTAANDGVDLFRPALANGTMNIGPGKAGTAPDKGSSEAVLGSLGGARFIATIEFWHGTDAVIYVPGSTPSEPWTRQVIGAGDFQHGHGMAVGDLNRDGFDEVIGGGGQGTMAQIIYRYVPSSRTWDKISLDEGGVAVSAIDVGDLNGDGAIDIMSIGTSPTNNVVWYENSGKR
jgi:aldos-2-ulose dehydratase/isomerase family protein/VCBS repeat protein